MFAFVKKILKERECWKVGFSDDAKHKYIGGWCVFQRSDGRCMSCWLILQLFIQRHTQWPCQKDIFFGFVQLQWDYSGYSRCAAFYRCPFVLFTTQGWVRTPLHLNLSCQTFPQMGLLVFNLMVRDRIDQQVWQQMKTKKMIEALLRVWSAKLFSDFIGDFTGWITSTEVLPYDTSSIPPGAVVCNLPQYRWVFLGIRR